MIPVPQSLWEQCRLQGEGRRWMWMGLGWGTDGYFAVRVLERGEAAMAEIDEDQAKREANVKVMLAAQRRPLTERAGWRIAFVPGPGKIACRTCRGGGQHKCDDCETSHECGNCQGSGKEFDYCPREHGQVVLDGPDGLTVVASGRFAPLLDAATSIVSARESDKQDPRAAPVLCLDEAAEVFAIVMPTTDEPVPPKRSP